MWMTSSIPRSIGQAPEKHPDEKEDQQGQSESLEESLKCRSSLWLGRNGLVNIRWIAWYQWMFG